jgi:hypothetical protein
MEDDSRALALLSRAVAPSKLVTGAEPAEKGKPRAPIRRFHHDVAASAAEVVERGLRGAKAGQGDVADFSPSAHWWPSTRPNSPKGCPLAATNGFSHPLLFTVIPICRRAVNNVPPMGA